MGEVYRAEDSELHRSVALKVLPEALTGDHDRLARFIQEARSASALNHPHIVAIFDIGRAVPQAGGEAPAMAKPVQYIAMELVSGVTLRAALDERRLDLKRSLEYLGQAAEAIAAAHAAGVVHRDLKPENLMIADGGYVKVLDFGLAKLRGDAAIAGDAGATVTGTAPGVVMGTVGYMSPEQALGRPVDQRSDVFSFGCVIYETVTGSRPFGGNSVVDTLHQIIHADPAPIAARVPAAPADLQRIVRKCLAKDPEERYQSMKEVAIDLRDLRRQLDSGPVMAAAPVRRGFSTLAIAAVVVLLVAAGGMALWKTRGGLPVEPPGQITFQTLTNSGNVIDAALSRDGNYLAYVESAEGKQGLWLRQVSGARPIEIVPAAPVGFFGVAFANDGRSIYYTVKGRASPLGTLFEVPALGGAPRAVLNGIDSGPSFSPDGRQLAYLRATYPDAASSSVMIANTDGTSSRALASRKAPEAFSPGFFASPSWSPDGSRVSATMRNTVARSARLMTIAVADGAVTAFPDIYADATFTEWLPDGSGFLFVARKVGTVAPGFAGQIYLQPYPSGPVRRITNDLIDYRVARSGPDGRSLLTVGYDASVALWTVPVDKPTAARKLPSLRRDGFTGVTWTRDGQRLLFGTFLRDHREIWSMAADGSDRRELITGGHAMWPCLSPDGAFMVFYSERGSDIGLWRAGLDGGGARLLTSVSTPGSVSISPDSQWVYFSSGKSGGPATYRVRASGGDTQLVADKLDRGVISPDGTMVTGIYDSGQGQSIGVLPVAGGPPVYVSPSVGFQSGAATLLWSADGRSVLYNSVERMNVWRQPLGGGAAEKVTDFNDETIFRFDLSPDGRQLALVRGRQTRDALMIGNIR
jgi:Tol biopolymer transport system component